MRWVSRLVTVGLAIVLVGAIALVIYLWVHEPSKYHFRSHAGFRDASRLPVGSRVMIAGVQVGEIVALTVDGRLARVSMRLRDDIELYDDAWAEKKAESLFGDGYIEIHPGTPEDGHRRLVSGDAIPRVHEGSSTDRTLRSVDQGMPRAQEALDNARTFADGARRYVDGELAPQLEDLERQTRDPDLLGGLASAQSALEDFDESAAAAEAAVAEYGPKVGPALDDADEGLRGVTDDMREGKSSLRQSLANARAGMDEVDPYLADAAAFFDKLDREDFINDPHTANQIEDATDGAKELTRVLDRFQSFVNLRLELDILSRTPTVGIGVELASGADTFYFLEMASSGTGLFADVQIADQPGSGTWVRTAKADEGPLLTLQWGHRFEQNSVRFGLRDNELAAGVDSKLFGNLLEFHSDLFLPTYRRVPRLKLAAAMRLFEQVYVMAGVDDMLRKGTDVPIMPWPAGQDVPEALETVHDGRDFFVGGYLRFTDRDLDTLLILYGAAIFAAL